MLILTPPKISPTPTSSEDYRKISTMCNHGICDLTPTTLCIIIYIIGVCAHLLCDCPWVCVNYVFYCPCLHEPLEMGRESSLGRFNLPPLQLSLKAGAPQWFCLLPEQTKGGFLKFSILPCAGGAMHSVLIEGGIPFQWCPYDAQYNFIEMLQRRTLQNVGELWFERPRLELEQLTCVHERSEALFYKQSTLYP